MYDAIRHTRRRSDSPDAFALGLIETKESAAKRTGLRGRRDWLIPADIESDVGIAVDATIHRPECSLAPGELQVVYPDPGCEPVYLLGLGSEGAIDARHVRQAAAALARQAFSAEVSRLEIVLNADHLAPLGMAMAGEAIGEGLTLGNLQFTQFAGAAALKSPMSLKLSVHAAGGTGSGLARGIERGLAMGESANLARRLAATPPNVADPAFIVAEARRIAKQAGLKLRVIQAAELEKLGLRGLLAVGGAGSRPPALICLEHHPADGTRRSRSTARRGAGGKASRAADDGPILLAGKAVTFDTGGYSLKPRDGMSGMKYDKCGGMAVLGAMHAIGTQKLKQHVLGIIPVVENMIDREAYRVDDILTMYNGVTVEVANTDAEGRLILADAMAWGCEHYKPRAVVDLATLTGGVVIALGNHCAGLFCNDEALRDRLIAAGDRAHERVWPLPLWDEHRELMKGTHCDLVNAGARKAHPIQGAAFLSYFVGAEAPRQMPSIPWAHVDIAGVAALDKATGNLPVGPTGFGVRLLYRAIEAW